MESVSLDLCLFEFWLFFQLMLVLMTMQRRHYYVHRSHMNKQLLAFSMGVKLSTKIS